MASTSDHTINRVAFCSAIFAGVAYVGYSVVKQVFTKGKKNKDGNHQVSNIRSRRVYLRRLSGSDASTSTEALLGTLENDGRRARLVLRPLSVQERIRELNTRARHFAETILAVQLQQDEAQRGMRSLQYTRSLQVSPTRCSSRTGPILSPIEITQLGSSRCCSVENLDLSDISTNEKGHNPFVTNSLPRNFRKRWSRRSLRMRNSDSGTFSNKGDQDEVELEGERMLIEKQEELRKRLQSLEKGTARILTPLEAKSLVALLHSKDTKMLEKALVTISNSAAFTPNQDLLRENGCLKRLRCLILHEESQVQVAALIAVSNMALNTSNQKEMKDIVPSLLPIACQNDGCGVQDHLRVQVLTTLTNMSVLSDWHSQFVPFLSRLFELTQTPHVKLQALRLMVNLSTNDKFVPHILAAKAPDYVWNMLDDSLSDEELLRVITLLANLVCTNQKLRVSDPTLDLPQDDRFSDSDSMYSQIFGAENREDVLEHLSYLMDTHAWEDIRVKARMIHNVVEKMEVVEEEED